MLVGASLEFSKSAHTFTGLVTGGSDNFFVNGAFGRTSYDGFDSGSTNFGATLGAQLKAGGDKKFEVCPTFTIGRSMGPNNDAFDLEYSSLRTSPGVSMGFVASQSGQTEIVPTLGFTLEHSRNTVDDGFDKFTDGTTYGSIGLGVGFVFNKKFSAQPAVYIPVGLDEGEVVYQVIATLSLGN